MCLQRAWGFFPAFSSSVSEMLLVLLTTLRLLRAGLHHAFYPRSARPGGDCLRSVLVVAVPVRPDVLRHPRWRCLLPRALGVLLPRQCPLLRSGQWPEHAVHLLGLVPRFVVLVHGLRSVGRPVLQLDEALNELNMTSSYR